jgi:hypothetical protein
MAVLDQRSPARYAVVFWAAEEASTPGTLVVEEDRLLLEGRGRDGLFELAIPYSDLTGVRIGRIADERLNGRPALLLERRERPVVQVVPFGPGLLHELAHLLAALVGRDSGDRDEVAVVVPLRAVVSSARRNLFDKVLRSTQPRLDSPDTTFSLLPARRSLSLPARTHAQRSSGQRTIPASGASGSPGETALGDGRT